MHPPLPKRPSEETDWRTRLRSLRNIRPLLGLVWDTNPFLVSASMVLRLFRALLPLASLWVGKLILDKLVALLAHRGNAERIWWLVALEIAIAVAGDGLGRLNALCDSLLGDLFTNRISVKLMQHASRLDLASFEDPVFYDKLERARRQTSGRLGMLASLLNIAQDLISLISLSVGLLVFSPWLMLLLALAVIPSFLGETHFTALAYSVFAKWTPQRRELDYLRMLGASVNSAKEVKLFGLGDYFAERYRDVSNRVFGDTKRLAIRRAGLGFLLNLISTGGYYAAYGVVIARTIQGAISIGTLTFLTRAFSSSRSYIEKILSSANDVSEQALFLKDLFELFELQPRIEPAAGASGLPAPRPIRSGFEFRNVAFSYAGSTRRVISNVSFRLDRAEKVALIGQNGAGKTTIVKLLARLYDPTEGQIFLDGIDLREYDPASLREEIGVIFQDYMRYDLMIRENIGFGKLSELTDRERIEQSARKSLASELVERVAGGLDQMVGRRFEGGVELSGGEWQRIALARAYMRDAQLLILDEPTATLDARAEYEVFQRFAELSEGKMSVLISHRFSTVRMADRILVLSNGEIIEQGSHRQLLELGGRYAELFELQAAGYR